MTQEFAWFVVIVKLKKKKKKKKKKFSHKTKSHSHHFYIYDQHHIIACNIIKGPLVISMKISPSTKTGTS